MHQIEYNFLHFSSTNSTTVTLSFCWNVLRTDTYTQNRL